MTLNRKVITQVDQVLAITYVYGGCQCIKSGWCHLTRTRIGCVGEGGKTDDDS